MTKKEEDYIKINRDLWNRKVDFHMDSDFYDLAGFLKGKSSLNPIELELLGNISGKKILHLQCHFGQDSISLSRMGAKVTGVDLSDKAIKEAGKLAEKTGEQAEFICCDIFELPGHLNQKYDLVFTSYGTIGWLPDLNKWAAVISHYLKPGGRFIFAEFHPVIWMFDEDMDKIKYRYFRSEAIIETETGTYANKKAAITEESVNWNHGIGEVVNSLIQNGLEIKSLNEYDYSPYDCFNKTIEDAPQKFRIKHLGNKIPMVYSILAIKK
ncbi:MAG: SAM-dependent methyltransferase [Flavobacteriia bacterium]|nr:MAG: SAM-dependent methyltransferase [Flavobacteriia bacterium]